MTPNLNSTPVALAGCGALVVALPGAPPAGAIAVAITGPMRRGLLNGARRGRIFPGAPPMVHAAVSHPAAAPRGRHGIHGLSLLSGRVCNTRLYSTAICSLFMLREWLRLAGHLVSGAGRNVAMRPMMATDRPPAVAGWRPPAAGAHESVRANLIVGLLWAGKLTWTQPPGDTAEEQRRCRAHTHSQPQSVLPGFCAADHAKYRIKRALHPSTG